ncbi:hypothetical protein B6N60_01854 [Richelia sinica FACHB-800]|uniref:Uncharacterized protein n=1 Tax=Richelia sinica FACHB-800 TaxID=1357546 RepID=A0A975T763_9NOST|nr:hypothetical protein [Richelia sinica]MBD2664731.1 hypothetical protein [Richelia sinica FACHB-800]QXE23165.1 hypothetical protein B6N60_01854 [Richelia sinica FACHB-800]
MTYNSLPNEKVHQNIHKSDIKNINVQNEQDRIYSFFLNLLKQRTATEVIQEFKNLFIDCLYVVEDDSKIPAVYATFLDHKELDFRNTIKRCCYILVNNWEGERKYKYIVDLVNVFEAYQNDTERPEIEKVAVCFSWLDNFVKSKDYQDLKTIAAKYESQNQVHWSNRYTAYLLAAQASDENNSEERRETAKKLSKRLKDKFKFDLAMYITYAQSGSARANKYKNPTILGDNVIRLIKIIVSKKGAFSYTNIANIFIRQTQSQTLAEFKESLQKYLLFSSVELPDFVANLGKQLTENLDAWKSESNDAVINPGLFLRTCNRVIDLLTTENGREPASLFNSLISEGRSLTLVILLLKIVLISKNSRNHLEVRIAKLINIYESYPEDECYCLINFMEVFNITFAIHGEDIEYNLIHMKGEKKPFNPASNLDDYRVFSQLKLGDAAE